MKKIVLTGGGTAGHVTPNIALMPKLKEEGWDISYIGTEKGIEHELIEREGIPYYPIRSGKLRRYLSMENVKDAFRVLGGISYAKKALKKIKPAKDINIVVDACGALLTNTLKYRPFLIKPNIFELSEIFGLKTLPDTKQIAACARSLQKQGARNVIVSMGGDGAVMVTETDQALYVRAARGQLVNSVGAGDSMIAGFIHEYLKSGNYFSSLNFATAAGSACAFTQHLATREQIEYIESLML